MSHDTFTDHDHLPLSMSHAALSAEIVVLRHELAEARAALRDLVNAAVIRRVVGYAQVREEAMDEAERLVAEWFRGRGVE